MSLTSRLKENSQVGVGAFRNGKGQPRVETANRPIDPLGLAASASRRSSDLVIDCQVIERPDGMALAVPVAQLEQLTADYRGETTPQSLLEVTKIVPPAVAENPRSEIPPVEEMAFKLSWKDILTTELTDEEKTALASLLFLASLGTTAAVAILSSLR